MQVQQPEPFLHSDRRSKSSHTVRAVDVSPVQEELVPRTGTFGVEDKFARRMVVVL